MLDTLRISIQGGLRPVTLRLPLAPLIRCEAP